MNETGIGSFLDSVTAGMRLVLSKELINTYGHLTFIHFYPEVLIQRLTIAYWFTTVL